MLVINNLIKIHHGARTRRRPGANQAQINEITLFVKQWRWVGTLNGKRAVVKLWFVLVAVGCCFPGRLIAAEEPLVRSLNSLEEGLTIGSQETKNYIQIQHVVHLLQ